jgi:beta-glucosidase
MRKQLALTFMFAMTICYAAPAQKWFEQKKDQYNLITNTGGQTLGYSTSSGVKIITEKGLAFKDLNKNGKLDPYEDWRLPLDKRAADLASKMSIEQIAVQILGMRPTPVRNIMQGVVEEFRCGLKHLDSQPLLTQR